MPFKSRKQQQWYNASNQDFYDDLPHDARIVNRTPTADYYDRDGESVPHNNPRWSNVYPSQANLDRAQQKIRELEFELKQLAGDTLEQGGEVDILPASQSDKNMTEDERKVFGEAPWIKEGLVDELEKQPFDTNYGDASLRYDLRAPVKEGLQDELMNIGQNIIHDPNIHDLLHHIPHVLAHAVAVDDRPKKSKDPLDKPFNAGGFESPKAWEMEWLPDESGTLVTPQEAIQDPYEIIWGNESKEKIQEDYENWITTVDEPNKMDWIDWAFGHGYSRERAKNIWRSNEAKVKTDAITGRKAQKGNPKELGGRFGMSGFESDFDDFMSNISIQDDDGKWWQHKTHEGQWDLNDDGEVTDEEWFKEYQNNVDYSKQHFWKGVKKALTGKEEWKPESETKWGELETNPHLLKQYQSSEADRRDTDLTDSKGLKYRNCPECGRKIYIKSGSFGFTAGDNLFDHLRRTHDYEYIDAEIAVDPNWANDPANQNMIKSNAKYKRDFGESKASDRFKRKMAWFKRTHQTGDPDQKSWDDDDWERAYWSFSTTYDKQWKDDGYEAWQDTAHGKDDTGGHIDSEFSDLQHELAIQTLKQNIQTAELEIKKADQRDILDELMGEQPFSPVVDVEPERFPVPSPDSFDPNIASPIMTAETTIKQMQEASHICNDCMGNFLGEYQFKDNEELKGNYDHNSALMSGIQTRHETEDEDRWFKELREDGVIDPDGNGIVDPEADEEWLKSRYFHKAQQGGEMKVGRNFKHKKKQNRFG